MSDIDPERQPVGVSVCVCVCGGGSGVEMFNHSLYKGRTHHCMCVHICHVSVNTFYFKLTLSESLSSVQLVLQLVHPH